MDKPGPEMTSSRLPLQTDGNSEDELSAITESVSNTPSTREWISRRTQLQPPLRPCRESHGSWLCLCMVLPPWHGASVELPCIFPEIVCRISCIGCPCFEIKSSFSSIVPAYDRGVAHVSPLSAPRPVHTALCPQRAGAGSPWVRTLVALASAAGDPGASVIGIIHVSFLMSPVLPRPPNSKAACR